MLTEEFTADVKARVEAALGLAGNRVLLASTHTHLGPVIRGGMAGEPDPDYLEWLATALVEVVQAAIADLEEARLFSGEGFLEELAYNRRGYHKDGRVDMYHGSWADDFDGVEGPRDGRLAHRLCRKSRRRALRPSSPLSPSIPTRWSNTAITAPIWSGRYVPSWSATLALELSLSI